VKVALLCGPSPAGRCGVGDYTGCLVKALRAGGVKADVVSSGDWNLASAFRVRRYLREQAYDLVHIQYPTVGFGTRLGPQGLALLERCVVTLHEASRVHILRKLALVPFAIRPKHLIFTSHFERDFVVRWMPRVSRFSSVIPIGNNVRIAAGEGPRNLEEIVYFGLIMPKKGLENVIKLGEIIKSRELSFRIRILGSAPPKHGEYFENLKARTATLPIIWDCGLNEQQIASKLAASSIAYLPYPDGVSERRATLSAAVQNGVAVITTRGPQTPPDLEGLVRFCESPEEALAAATFLAGNPKQRAELVDQARWYARQFDWERIADLHGALYQQLLSFQSDRDAAGLRAAKDEKRLVQK
jgi:glycosyltransferase involved in cell wall biosynthesis